MKNFIWGVLREMPGFKDQNIEVFANFYGMSCDTTQFSRFLAVVMQFPVILRFFSVQNIEKFGFFQFQNQANFEGFCNTPKIFFSYSQKYHVKAFLKKTDIFNIFRKRRRNWTALNNFLRTNYFSSRTHNSGVFHC